MFLEETFTSIADSCLFMAGLFLLIGSILITIKTRFVQLRVLTSTFRAFFQSLKNGKNKEASHTIPPYKALFMAMTTTAGIGTIVAPVIAIHYGGPGALLGFLITSFLGSAATYTEVSLCTQHKKTRRDGTIIGGPMPYLEYLFSKRAALWYAVCCCLLMVSWSGAQANQLAAIMDSSLLGEFHIPKVATGLAISTSVIFFLIGGVRRIGDLATKVLLPAHFVLYVGACLWIIFSNLDRLEGIFYEIIRSVAHPYQMATGGLVGGLVSSFRWGVFKGIHVCEGGIGTQTIPHSMAETNDTVAQGALAMLSTYTAGFIAFLSGLVALLTKTWESTHLPLGMSMVMQSFQIYFPTFGILIVAISVFIFGFGTILGNSYNGSHCFRFLTDNKGGRYYLFATGIVVFLGALSEVKVFWAFTDFILAAMALPHMGALLYYTFRKQKEESPVALSFSAT